MQDREPWYRHTLGGQGRTPDEVEKLAGVLIWFFTCAAVLGVYLLIQYLSQ